MPDSWLVFWSRDIERFDLTLFEFIISGFEGTQEPDAQFFVAGIAMQELYEWEYTRK